jgi:hypothetical protein
VTPNNSLNHIFQAVLMTNKEIKASMNAHQQAVKNAADARAADVNMKFKAPVVAPRPSKRVGAANKTVDVKPASIQAHLMVPTDAPPVAKAVATPAAAAAFLKATIAVIKV